MSRSFLTIVASLLVCAACVSAVCDETAFSQIRKCVYKSAIYNNVMFPRNLTAVDEFCMKDINTTYNCLHKISHDCEDNSKQMKLMKLTVDLDSFRKSLEEFCSKKTVLSNNAQCLTDVFGGDAYRSCVDAAIGIEINAGDPKDVKSGLSTDCKFFDAFTTCHTDQFKDACKAVGTQYAKLTEAGRYKYCSMSVVEREAALLAYNATGAASFHVYSMSVIFLGITAWISL